MPDPRCSPTIDRALPKVAGLGMLLLPSLGKLLRGVSLRLPRHRRAPPCLTTATLSIAGLLCAFATLPPQPALAQRTSIEPEAATGRQSRPLAKAHRHMVATAHPLATQAGLEMLRAGGSASDAAIAAQLVLGLVEPQSSGLGGGGFLLAWDAATRRLSSYDGRETAPAAAGPDRFAEGRQLEGLIGTGLAVGVPGVPRLLEVVHRRHGRLPWPRLFEPAIRLADAGFPVSPRLNALLARLGAHRFEASARTYFFSGDGRAREGGGRLAPPPYAATLRALARQGADAFYAGAIGAAVVAAARSAADLPSEMTAADLAAYRVIERPQLCSGYRGRSICGMGPPSSGGIAVAQIMTLLEPFELARPVNSALPAAAVHLVAEAQKLAYADRNRYIGDPDHAAIPAGLTDADYLAGRRALIEPGQAMRQPAAGRPAGFERRAMGEDATLELAGTSHLSIVDGMGNAIAMTTTVEAAFGSRIWAAGFLLNNQLTDFALRPRDAAGRPLANAAGPGKRPRSSMAPTMVFDSQGGLEAVLGSPGGSRIILYVTKALIGLIDWGLDPQAAAELANFGSLGAVLELESGGNAELAADLAAMGHQVKRDEMTSGLHIVVVSGDRLLGGVDPRREGLAAGD